MTDEASKGYSRDERDGHNPSGYISDSINEMVSGFLEGLDDICSETKMVCQPDADEDGEILPAGEPDKTNQTLPSDEAIRAKSKPSLAEIIDEVEETWIKPEHLNSKTIPATDQRESKEKSSSFPPMKAEQLVSESVSSPVAKLDASQSVAEPAAPEPVVELPKPQSFDATEEKMWEGLETLRSSIANPNSSFLQRQKHLIFSVAAVILILAIGGFYFLWQEMNPQVSETFGQIQNSQKQTSSTLLPLGSVSTALVGGERDVIAAFPASSGSAPRDPAGHRPASLNRGTGQPGFAASADGGGAVSTTGENKRAMSYSGREGVGIPSQDSKSVRFSLR